MSVFSKRRFRGLRLRLRTTEEQLGVYVSAAETQRLTELAAALRSELGSLTAEWEELMLQLDGA